MYGAPSSSAPTSSTRATCSLFRRTRARASRRKRATDSGARVAAEELDRDALVELEVRRRDDDAHAARADDRVDAVFVRDDLARRELEHAWIVPQLAAQCGIVAALPGRGPVPRRPRPRRRACLPARRSSREGSRGQCLAPDPHAARKRAGTGRSGRAYPLRSRRSVHVSMSTASSPLAGTSARSSGASRRCSGMPCWPSRSAAPRRAARRRGPPPAVVARRVGEEGAVVAGAGLAQPSHRVRRRARHVDREHPDQAGASQQRVDAGEQPGHRSAARRVLADEGDGPRRRDGVRRDHDHLVGVEERVDRDLQQGSSAELDARLVDPVHPRGRAAGQDDTAEAGCGEVEVHGGILAVVSRLAVLAPQPRKDVCLRWSHG